MERPAYRITAACRGSDLVGETAAAMAASAMVFADSDPSYARTLVSHAEQLYDFADTHHGVYSECITDAVGYRFTLEPGVAPDDISLSSPYSQCADPTGPVAAGGSVYYVTVDRSGQHIHPGGQSEHRREVQLRISSAGDWDPSNDWSYQNLPDDLAEAERLPLYDGDTRVWGAEPS